MSILLELVQGNLYDLADDLRLRAEILLRCGENVPNPPDPEVQKKL